jgi:carboxyl-terminal processing protease
MHTLVALAVGALLGAGLMLAREVTAPREAAATTAAPAKPRNSLLDEVAERVRSEYLDAVTPDQLEHAAADGMVASLDPYSDFLDAAEYEAMRVTTEGHYSGVGLEVAEQKGEVVVVAPIEGSPAAQAGVRTGDVLLEVNGIDVTAGRLDAAIDGMRGRMGTRVHLVVARTGEPRPLQFDLVRTDVRVQTVRSAALPGGYGYLRISHFNDATPQDLRRQLLGLQADAPLPGLVLDLGGVLESAVAVADDFLDEGVIVRAEGRTSDSRFEMDATEGDMLRQAPLVVLVDHGSASGAEIVAGALRDHGRATLIGERTFGKGSVQTVLPLRDGQALKLTTSRYFTPSGDSIHERGIEPDVAVEGGSAHDVADDAVVQVALQYLRDRSLGRQVALAGSH